MNTIQNLRVKKELSLQIVFKNRRYSLYSDFNAINLKILSGFRTNILDILLPNFLLEKM